MDSWFITANSIIRVRIHQPFRELGLSDSVFSCSAAVKLDHLRFTLWQEDYPEYAAHIKSLSPDSEWASIHDLIELVKKNS